MLTYLDVVCNDALISRACGCVHIALRINLDTITVKSNTSTCSIGPTKIDCKLMIMVENLKICICTKRDSIKKAIKFLAIRIFCKLGDLIFYSDWGLLESNKHSFVSTWSSRWYKMEVSRFFSLRVPRNKLF